MGDEKALPAGWAWATLGELGTWIGGGTPSKQEAAYWTKGTIPWVSPKDMKCPVIADSEDQITEQALASSATQLIPEGSVLIVTRSGILQRTVPVAINRVPVTVNQDLKALTPNGAMLPEFLANLVRSQEQEVLGQCSKAGTTVASIDFERLKGYSVPVPPPAEQRRIVARIEVLQERTRRARAALDQIPEQLERLRQSVLAAAFRGDLTAEWREANPHAEPAEVLLERIRAERRRQWEEAELAKLRAKRKEPKDDRWKAKYVEPDPVDASALPELPAGWVWTTIDELVKGHRSIAYGVVKPGEHVPDGVRFIKSGQVRDGFLDLSEDHRISEHLDAQYRRTRLEGGEVLLNLVGASIGRSAVAPSELAGANVTRAIAVIPTVEGMAEWAQLALQGPVGQQLVQASTGGSAQPVLNLAEVRRLPIPVPPSREIQEVIRRVRAAQASHWAVASAASDARERLAEVEEAILARAFRGELVPQDPNDEPASELLERIRAEQAAAPVRRGRRRTR